jgi:predicted hotdog family 3-hydroxylacyl-ACP dehydratase
MQLQPGFEYRIEDLLPHGPGFVLLDRVARYEPETVTCEVAIRPDSRFCDGRAVPAWVGIEYMAQAFGAFTGIAHLQGGRRVQLEMLLGTRAYDAQVAEFPVGSRLAIHARQLFWDPDGVCAFACEIRDGERVLARSELKGFDPVDLEPFLRSLVGGAATDGARGSA